MREIRKNGKKYFECRCACGTVRTVKAQSVISGRSKSCGCYKAERAKEEIRKNSKNRIDTNAMFNTNFQSIERDKPYKNNKSGHKGVYFSKEKGTWKALIYVQKKSIYLGSFHDIKDAIRAREDAEKQYFLPLIEAKRAINNCQKENQSLSMDLI